MADGASERHRWRNSWQARTKPRCVWLMLPAAITGKIVDQVATLMEPGDIIIDGGNSYYMTTSIAPPGSGTRA